jgi:SAM-dependent methyltransferase
MSQCIWCGASEADPVLQWQDRVEGRLHNYVRCRQCGVIRLDPRPSLEEAARNYPPTYEAFGDPRENWLFRLGRRRNWTRRIHALHRYLAVVPGDALDIGCATGEFLEVLQEQGWHVTGVEPNSVAAERACRRLGVEAVKQAPFEKVGFAQGSFDLITLWDVLNYLQDPPVALRRMHGWLRPEGLLALGVPNLGSWDARLFGQAWLGWDAPQHLYLIPDEALRAALTREGFQVIATRCLYGGYGSLIWGVESHLRKRCGNGRVGQALHQLVRMRPARYLFWPYFRLGEWVGRGPIQTYFCRPAGASAYSCGRRRR